MVLSYSDHLWNTNFYTLCQLIDFGLIWLAWGLYLIDKIFYYYLFLRKFPIDKNYSVQFISKLIFHKCIHN